MKVFIIIRKEDLLILGCFDTKIKAEKYANNSVNVLIKELKVI